MFKSSSNSDIFVRFIPDSWMLLLDSSVYAGSFAAGRVVLSYHRDSPGFYMSYLNRTTLTSGKIHFFPRAGVTEDVTYSTNLGIIGAYTKPYLICAPDYLMINVSETVTGEEITTVLRAILPDSTKPTVVLSAGIYGTTDTNDYNTVTELINSPLF